MKGTALITGASVGIGNELARQFASHGHNLILVARNRDQLEALAGTLEGKHGITATVIVMDLAHADAPQRLYDACAAEGLDVDILVNNAGFGYAGPFAETDIEGELDMIQVMITGLTHLTKLFMQPMIRRKRGRILNVASIAGFQPGPLMSVYYASKAYVVSLSQAIDEELRKTGVTVTCLCPGPTATEFAGRAGLSTSRLFRLGRVSSAEEVARFGYVATMRGDRIAIPGMTNKAVVLVERVIPRAIVTRLARKVQENR